VGGDIGETVPGADRVRYSNLYPNSAATFPLAYLLFVVCAQHVELAYPWG